jgi:methylated-DNA-[protein]-cysteine S-methyltransferase
MPESISMEMSIELEMQQAWLAIPLGYLKIIGSPLGIKEVVFKDYLPTGEATRPADSICRPIRQALEQLDAYFDGHQKQFSFPLNPEGTPFQLRVWNELVNIPFGETTSYIRIAQKLGDKKLVRAVGMANGKNPIAISIPCHRIIGHNGNLVGYAGGLWRKEWLLKHEAQFSGKPVQLSLF